MRKRMVMVLCILCSNCEQESRRQSLEEFEKDTQEEQAKDSETASSLKDTEETSTEQESVSSEEQDTEQIQETEQVQETDTYIEVDTYTEIDTYTEVDTYEEVETDTIELDSEGCYTPPSGLAQIKTQEDVEFYSQFKCINGSLFLQASKQVSLPELEKIKGMLSIWTDSIEVVSMSRLHDIEQGISMASFGGNRLRRLDLPSLVVLKGGLGFSNTLISSIDGFKNLMIVEGFLTITMNSELPQCEACRLATRLKAADSHTFVSSNLQDECGYTFPECPRDGKL